MPNIPGYVTLKCDFHLHTVFSDGQIWPTMRVEEAWRDGLDVIAITDHIEYQPHKLDVSTNLNRSYEIALPYAKSLDLLLIRAAEITRGEPPGHLNALFITDPLPLQHTNNRVATKAAADQGAFLFWNHPGWKQPDGKSVWYAEQGDYYTNGWLKGLEIVNGPEYDPIVHQWAIDKQLTMIGNSDVHDAIAWNLDRAAGEERPITLVFAREKTESAVKEALLGHRTAIFSGRHLYGDVEFLLPFFNESLVVRTPRVTVKGKGRGLLQVFNRSAVPFQLKATGDVMEAGYTKSVTLHPGKTSLIDVTRKLPTLTGQHALSLPFLATNLCTAPGKPLQVSIGVTVDFVP